MRHLRSYAFVLASLMLTSIAPAMASPSDSSQSTVSLPYVQYTVLLENGTVMKGNYVPQLNEVAVQGEGGIAYDSATGDLYVTHLFSNISVLDARTLLTIKKISVGGEPFDVIYDGADGNIYATNLIRQLNVINGTNAKITANISTGTFSSRMALNSNSNELYLPNLLNQSYEQISLGTPVSIKNVSTGSSRSTLKHPVQGIAYDSLNNTVFVSNFQTNSLVVLNATSGKMIRNIAFDNQIGAVTYNQAQNSVYFALTGDIKVLSMNASSYRITGNMTTGYYPSTIAFDNRAGYIFVTDEGNSTLSVYNMFTFQGIETLNVSLGPTGACFSVAQSRLYVLNTGTGTVSVIKVNNTAAGPFNKDVLILSGLGGAAIVLSTVMWMRIRKR